MNLSLLRRYQLPYLGKLLLLLVFYLLAAKFGFFMKEGSQYADLIWPPCGVSIALLIFWGWQSWPSVFLGSLLVNIWLSKSAIATTSPDILMGAFVGIGSTLQAIVGYFLIKKQIGFPLSNKKLQTNMTMFVGICLFSSLFSALIGTGTLYIGATITHENLLKNMMTWWLGDSIGTFVFLPLSLLAISKIQQSTEERL